MPIIPVGHIWRNMEKYSSNFECRVLVYLKKINTTSFLCQYMRIIISYELNIDGTSVFLVDIEN